MNIIFVSSFGGHWVQLTRVAKLVTYSRGTFITTKKLKETEGSPILTDFNLKDSYKSLKDLKKIYSTIKRINPDVVLSTGAAPGLLFLFIASLMGKKTIWVDSIANCKKISLSGKLAKLFCTKTLTQWPNLETSEIKCIGRLL
ncbi:Oligosaccharide biosynthesis protein Alg14 like protein [compost metagenome]